MSQASDIKARIKTILDGLVTATTLGEVIEDDLKLGIFDRDYSAFPVAILTSPSIESSVETNRDNVRTHNFEIVVLFKQEDLASVSDVEDLEEALLDAFDNDPTLGGTANAGLEPATTPKEAIPNRGKTYIAFSVILKAKAIKVLNY